MNAIHIVLIVVGSLIAVLLLRAVYIAARLPIKRPRDYPTEFLNELEKDQARFAGKTRVACLGDSITHGLVSVNYVELLKANFNPKHFTFINAGINHELAYNLLTRLDEVIACEPNIVTILIGTNDINTIMNKRPIAKYIKERSLPQTPTKDWFREMLRMIVQRLKLETEAKIALFSLPVIGEDPTHPVFQKTIEYSAVIKEVASQQDVIYLPLNEAMVSYLKEHPQPQIHDYDEQIPMTVKAVLRHFYFGTSLDQISEQNGFQLLTDFLHLNSRGAGMVVQLAEKFIRGINNTNLEN